VIPLNEIQRILVSRLRFVGDVILTTPMLRALREGFPSARITYLAEKPYDSLLKNHPDVDEVLAFPLDDKKGQIEIFLKLSRKHFDVAIDLFGNPRSALLTFLSGARYRIGGDYRGRKIFYTHRIRDDGEPKSAVAFHLEYLKPLGIPCDFSDPYIVITEDEKRWAREYLTSRGYDEKKQIIGIHPGASWPAKRWFPERFAALANKLASELGAQIFFTIGSGEEEIVKSVSKACKFFTAEPKVLSLRKLTALLSAFDLFISNDCGPMHMAPAVGTKTVGIFGPGEPEIWFPYSSKKAHRWVHREIDCSRCHRDLCDKMDCMRAIRVDDVFDAAIEALKPPKADELGSISRSLLRI